MSELGDTFRELRAEQAEDREEAVQRAHDELPAAVAAAPPGAVIYRWVDDYHAQAVFRGRVIAQWWPSRGRTMLGQMRGPRAATAADFVRLVEDLIRKPARRKT